MKWMDIMIILENNGKYTDLNKFVWDMDVAQDVKLKYGLNINIH
jgi:hypothetical protein